MKRKYLALGGVVALLGAGTAYSLHAQPSPALRMEKHPEIRRAIKALNNAEGALKSAKHDYAGHRVKALEDTQNAIQECQAALLVDEK